MYAPDTFLEASAPEKLTNNRDFLSILERKFSQNFRLGSLSLLKEENLLSPT